MRLDETRKEILHLRLSQRRRRSAGCAQTWRRRMRTGVWVSLSMRNALSFLAVLLLTSCATSNVEQNVDLGFGFRQVILAETSHSSFESVGHFPYLYFRSRQICQLGECSVSPSGRYAIYQDGPSGDLYLFNPQEGSSIQLAQSLPALVDRFEWDEETGFVEVRLVNGTASQRFRLLR